jgi:hypothetical protein
MNKTIRVGFENWQLREASDLANFVATIRPTFKSRKAWFFF